MRSRFLGPSGAGCGAGAVREDFPLHRARHQSSGCGLQSHCHPHRIHGKPGVLGDGVNDGLNTPTFFPASPYTVVIVADVDDVVTLQTLYQSFVSATETFILKTVDSEFRAQCNDGAVADARSIAATTGVHVFILTFDGTTTELYVDGVPSTGTTGSAFATTVSILIGARTNGTQQFLGTYSEFFAYNQVLNSGERARINIAMSAKYHIGVTT